MSELDPPDPELVAAEAALALAVATRDSFALRHHSRWHAKLLGSAPEPRRQ